MEDWPLAPVPGAGERAVLFAPHPDDEALGAGGLIHRAVRNGAEVRVFFLTSGDGFGLCAAERYRCWPTAAARGRLAAEREAEAVRSLGLLGLGPEQITFLRRPDGSLDALWRGVDTSGSDDLAGALDRALAGCVEYVWYPDAADDHPDHRAAHHLVRAALGRRTVLGETRPRERTYLIHHGRWPWPFRAAPERALLPPASLGGTGQWEVLPLGPDDLAAKQAAIRAHASQQRLMGYFLPAFIRSNELFRKPAE